MIETGYIAAFLVGLLGGVHCVGMCGGIVSALTIGLNNHRSFNFALHAAYSVGRIISYAIAGAIMGGLGVMLAGFLPVHVAQHMLLALAGVFMILLGLYLGGWWAVLTYVEKLGGFLWKRIEPLGRKYLPVKHWNQAIVLGLVWGWIPCGLVYSVLIWSVSAGSVVEGSLLMLAFGLGTLPNLLAMGMVAEKMVQHVRRPAVRQAAGILVILMGCYNLYVVINYLVIKVY